MNKLTGTPGLRRSLSRRGLLAGAGAGLWAGPLVADLQTPPAAVDPNALQPTNTFAHIAYGLASGGYWKTSFIFINLDATPSTVQLITYETNGSPKPVPVVGSTTDSQHTFTIPGNGTIVVELDQNASTGVTTGWAGVVLTGNVRGQGIFKQVIPGRPDFEALVPMVTPLVRVCILYFPPDAIPTPKLAMAFDNTEGYTTSVAFANTATSTKSLDLEFVDTSGASLYTAHESLAAHNQMAFETFVQYPAVSGKKGWMRVLNNVSDFTALGFRFNPTGAFSTWLPVLS